MPLLFNVDHDNQYYIIQSPAPHLNLTDAVTVEGVCTLAKPGADPTMISRPAGPKWEAPYVVYRLGFYSSTCRPEFQLLFENESEPTTIRSEEAAQLGRPTHIAGTYDGNTMRLYVDGVLVAYRERSGQVATNDEPTVLAARSSTDPGGLFIGTLQEFRIWDIARSATEIDLWKRRLLPVEPSPDGLVFLSDMEPGPPGEVAEPLESEGWSPLEIQLVHFVNWYAQQYNQRSKTILSDTTQRHFPTTIKTIIFVKTRDGYFAIYEPEFPRYLEPAEILGDSDSRGRILVLDRSNQTASDVIQSWTGNLLKIQMPNLGMRLEDAWTLPPDLSDVASDTVNADLLESKINLLGIAISPHVLVENGVVTGLSSRRVRAISPLVSIPDGSLARQFTWLFADFWFGELTRELVYLPETLHFLEADLQALQWTIDLLLPPQEMLNDGPTNAIDGVTQLLREFEILLDRPDVDEVRDIQPFLSDPRHWILLSPNHKNVWPQKMLGNKYRVDFVVQESDSSYIAIEIESPKFPIFTGTLNPSHQLSHTEQQARDYCDYIDSNRDTVERVEGLHGIFRPKGLVVIGRRRSLSVEAARKLVTRNLDGGRYTVMVYDDLIDRAQAVIDAVKRAITV